MLASSMAITRSTNLNIDMVTMWSQVSTLVSKSQENRGTWKMDEGIGFKSFNWPKSLEAAHLCTLFIQFLIFAQLKLCDTLIQETSSATATHVLSFGCFSSTARGRNRFVSWPCNMPTWQAWNFPQRSAVQSWCEKWMWSTKSFEISSQSLIQRSVWARKWFKQQTTRW